MAPTSGRPFPTEMPELVGESAFSMLSSLGLPLEPVRVSPVMNMRTVTEPGFTALITAFRSASNHDNTTRGVQGSGFLRNLGPGIAFFAHDPHQLHLHAPTFPWGSIHALNEVHQNQDSATDPTPCHEEQNLIVCPERGLHMTIRSIQNGGDRHSHVLRRFG